MSDGRERSLCHPAGSRELHYYQWIRPALASRPQAFVQLLGRRFHPLALGTMSEKTRGQTRIGSNVVLIVLGVRGTSNKIAYEF